MTVTDIDLSKVPGAFEHFLSRMLPDGSLIEFESAPAGWLKSDGTPRLADWRAYHRTPSGESKRARLVSVTTLLDTICPKPGIPVWAEARGIEGAVMAVRAGEINVHEDPPDRAVEIVRGLKLGADRARDAAADRGLNVHALLQEHMQTGQAPSLAGHPVEHHGYITGLSRWLLHAQPEPVAVEQLVANIDDGYAGRLDLRARIGGRLVTVDLKTQEKAGIYSSSHLQVNLYERAAVVCGDEPADACMVVVVAANGEFREMAADHEQWRIDAALLFAKAIKPIDSVCESHNRAERKARAA
jgi:hypothetical protein